MIDEIAEPAANVLFSKKAASDMMTAAALQEEDNNEESLALTWSRSNATSLMFELSFYVLLFYAGFVGLARTFLEPHFLAKWRIDEAKGLDIACKGVSACFATLAASLGAFIFIAVDHNPAAANKRVDFVLDHFLIFAMAYFLYDMYAMCEVYTAKNNATSNVAFSGNHREETCNGGQTSNSVNTSVQRNKPKDSKSNFFTFVAANPLMSAHHLVIALVFIPMMSQVRDHEPGHLMIATALVFEASTPFVALRSVLSDLGLKNSAVYVVNGLVMIAVFFSCRIAVYPLFYKLYSAHRGITYLEGLSRAPWHCNLFVLSTLLPQLYWFRLMVRGALKMLHTPQFASKDARIDSTAVATAAAANGKMD